MGKAVTPRPLPEDIVAVQPQDHVNKECENMAKNTTTVEGFESSLAELFGATMQQFEQDQAGVKDTVLQAIGSWQRIDPTTGAVLNGEAHTKNVVFRATPLNIRYRVSNNIVTRKVFAFALARGLDGGLSVRVVRTPNDKDSEDEQALPFIYRTYRLDKMLEASLGDSEYLTFLAGAITMFPTEYKTRRRELLRGYDPAWAERQQDYGYGILPVAKILQA